MYILYNMVIYILYMIKGGRLGQGSHITNFYDIKSLMRLLLDQNATQHHDTLTHGVFIETKCKSLCFLITSQQIVSRNEMVLQKSTIKNKEINDKILNIFVREVGKESNRWRSYFFKQKYNNSKLRVGGIACRVADEGREQQKERDK